jgi:hypothetical protein
MFQRLLATLLVLLLATSALAIDDYHRPGDLSCAHFCSKTLGGNSCHKY